MLIENFPEHSKINEIGDQSRFHNTFSIYADAVGMLTVVLPNGWKDRLVRIQMENSVGLCISLNDLTISKLYAHRDKDLEYVEELFKHKLVRATELLPMVDNIPDEVYRVLEDYQEKKKRIKPKIEYFSKKYASII